ncbi:MAG: tetratricopeptide repeat protein [Candidatus Magnetomorum sp.]|nr:tetratricopeptide repeat protein [Candidatus Magnetomorum sp.]
MKIVIMGFMAFFLLISMSFSEEIPYEEIKSCYDKSYAFENQKRYTNAITALKPIYLNYPNTYTVNYRLGWLYYLNQNYANALDHLNRAAAIFPQSTEIIQMMIYVYQAKADWETIEMLSVQWLKKDYYNISGNYWYAVSLKMQGKYSLAIKISNKMLVLQPTSTIFMQELGENLYLSNYLEESKSIFGNLLILYPGNATAIYYLNKMQKILSVIAKPLNPYYRSSQMN